MCLSIYLPSSLLISRAFFCEKRNPVAKATSYVDTTPGAFGEATPDGGQLWHMMT